MSDADSGTAAPYRERMEILRVDPEEYANACWKTEVAADRHSLRDTGRGVKRCAGVYAGGFGHQGTGQFDAVPVDAVPGHGQAHRTGHRDRGPPAHAGRLNQAEQHHRSPGQADDPNAPAITLPVLPDWKGTGAATPPYAYAGLINTDPATAADPPTIIVVFSKLEGADPAEILKLAPNEIRNLPEFNGDDEAKRAKLAGFDSVQIGGTYVRDGVTRLIGQKTVAIPGKDGLYVLQINADALKDQVVLLVTATDAMDRLATIKP